MDAFDFLERGTSEHLLFPEVFDFDFVSWWYVVAVIRLTGRPRLLGTSPASMQPVTQPSNHPGMSRILTHGYMKKTSIGATRKQLL